MTRCVCFQLLSVVAWSRMEVATMGVVVVALAHQLRCLTQLTPGPRYRDARHWEQTTATSLPQNGPGSWVEQTFKELPQ